MWPEGPFRIHEDQGVLHLALDTPDCEVNILSDAAAAQLRAVVERIEPDRHRALVLGTAKPGSWVNGVGLLLASAVQRVDDVARLSAGVRAAYRAVREAPVPTVAAIDGTCYGCGVELALCCDQRVATRGFDTHFVMTEVRDYLFVPAFGGTLALPRLLGLERAVELLLHGACWSAEEALEAGLVDEVCAPDALDATVARRLSEGAPPRPRPLLDPPAVVRTASWIEDLPPHYRPLYRRCLDLMVRSLAADADDEALAAEEMRAAGETCLEPAAKAALGFFFTRRTGDLLASRGARAGEVLRVGVADAEGPARALGAHIAARQLRDVVVGEQGEVVLWSEGDAVGVRVGPVQGRITTPLASGRLVELQAPREAPLPDVHRLLRRAGHEVVPTRGAVVPEIDRWVMAFFDPLVRWVEADRPPAAVDATLRGFGLVRRARHLLDELAVERVQELVSPAEVVDALRTPAAPDTAEVPELLDAVLGSLLAEALRARGEGTLSHPAHIDLLARELLDFPLALGSFCRFLERSGGDALICRAHRWWSLVAPHVPDRLAGWGEQRFFL